MIAFLALFFNAGRLASWMGDPHLASLMKVISFAFLFSPLIAILRGIFQGEGNMIPTAVSQVGEQLIRVGIILFVAVFFLIKVTPYMPLGQVLCLALLSGAYSPCSS
ncbi:oligosaccharide flippase family protein [Niallia circulans]